ncbi:MAG: 3-phosphoshikimate 1-carboxyvinyltransferase, partial [Pirellulaceae bacterium]
MSNLFTVPTSPGPLDAVIQPPGSKSITNRALVCAALADRPSRITGALSSEDT